MSFGAKSYAPLLSAVGSTASNACTGNRKVALCCCPAPPSIAVCPQGQAGAKRASYEARWQFFVTKHTEAAVGYGDVPWILPQQLEGAAGTEELQHVVLYGERLMRSVDGLCATFSRSLSISVVNPCSCAAHAHECSLAYTDRQGHNTTGI